MEIGLWLNKVDETRGEVIRWVKTLKKADRDLMATEALRCHLPQAASFKRHTKLVLQYLTTWQRKQTGLNLIRF